MKPFTMTRQLMDEYIIQSGHKHGALYLEKLAENGGYSKQFVLDFTRTVLAIDPDLNGFYEEYIGDKIDSSPRLFMSLMEAGYNLYMFRK